MPEFEQVQAKKVARQLSSLSAVQQCLSTADGDNKEQAMRQTLRLIAKRMLNAARRRQGQDGHAATTTLGAANQEVQARDKINRLSVCSDDAPQLKAWTKYEDAPSNSTKQVEPSTAASNNKNYDHQAKAARHHLLINLLGESTYNEILSTTEEIKSIRHNSATWTKFSRINASNGLLIDDERDAPASQTLPRPIYDLYFATRLIDVMRVVDSRSKKMLEEMPEPCSCIVERVDWKVLLEDAKVKLEAFRRFEEENVGPEDNLSFSCFGGMCGRRR
ncbi:hypothetical protein ACHAWO_010166 [Cyclotella atomus]|uniref:Uncharacterized protein n=1 Tax=Cyclotella atomus TaxID=382360 RepID=A0ABD3QFJ9_9STRA